MTSEQQQVKNWMTSFGQEVPEKPTIPNKEVRLLRAKLILEEALETIDALGVELCIEKSPENDDTQYVRIQDIEFESMPESSVNDLVDIADGCEDLKVVTEGTLVACGLCKPRTKTVTEGDHYGTYNTRIKDMTDPLFDEVMRSNWSKLWTYEESKQVSDNIHLITKIKLNLDTPRESTKYLVKDRNGKIIKPPSYLSPNLQPIIDELSK